MYDIRESPNSKYPERFTGITVGVRGSLFVAGDQTGDIYRVRPTVR
jgi:glucose/arabinose dehydrogenase